VLKNSKILNTELNHMLASMGHTDILFITDAGCPIPKDAWVVDLSITRNVPELVPVLELIASEFLAEKVIYADYVPEHNKPYHEDLKRIFNDCGHETVSQEELLNEVTKKAKGFIRTGGYTPWGNIALVTGVDPDDWFYDPRITLPGTYEERRDQVRSAKNRK
jgi:D-ribose pyranase